MGIPSSLLYGCNTLRKLLIHSVRYFSHTVSRTCTIHGLCAINDDKDETVSECHTQTGSLKWRGTKIENPNDTPNPFNFIYFVKDRMYL